MFPVQTAQQVEVLERYVDYKKQKRDAELAALQLENSKRRQQREAELAQIKADYEAAETQRQFVLHRKEQELRRLRETSIQKQEVFNKERLEK